MGTDQLMYCIVALILGMLLSNMLKSVCGCKVVEGQRTGDAAGGVRISLVAKAPTPSAALNLFSSMR